VAELLAERRVDEVAQPAMPDDPGAVEQRAGDAGARDARHDQAVARIEVASVDDRLAGGRPCLSRHRDVRTRRRCRQPVQGGRRQV
jgi:hypothetical protein